MPKLWHWLREEEEEVTTLRLQFSDGTQTEQNATWLCENAVSHCAITDSSNPKLQVHLFNCRLNDGSIWIWMATFWWHAETFILMQEIACETLWDFTSCWTLSISVWEMMAYAAQVRTWALELGMVHRI